jgi:hypothetical protein
MLEAIPEFGGSSTASPIMNRSSKIDASSPSKKGEDGSEGS